MSGIGKGIATSSIGKILQSRGYRITALKIDPYINVDAGTMNPIEHGEVFVTADGMECDQDIGNYERFLGEEMHGYNYMTTGAVYLSVITKERNLEFDGKCVEVVPHVPLLERGRPATSTAVVVHDEVRRVVEQVGSDLVGHASPGVGFVEVWRLARSRGTAGA